MKHSPYDYSSQLANRSVIGGSLVFSPISDAYVYVCLWRIAGAMSVLSIDVLKIINYVTLLSVCYRKLTYANRYKPLSNLTFVVNCW